MRYATVRIPEGHYPEGDPALRYDGQRVRVLGRYQEASRGPNDRHYRHVETEEGGMIMPEDWLK